MTDKDETKRLERATLDIEKLKVNYWSLWQELGEIRKEIEGLNRAKEGEEQDQREWKYGMVKWSNEIDELITRHKATLDLLAKPARTPIQKAEDLVGFYNKPGPAECGCIDKAKLIHSLDCRANAHKRQGDKVERENRPELAAKLYIREELFRGLIDRINEGEYDRAPCKPEPAPAETGEVIGFLPYYKDGESYIKVRLDDGTFAFFRGMPEEEWEREHTCRCSTANLVEQLRSRASVADGIDVTDLDADQLLEIGGNKPMTVIAVRKEENRS